MMIPINGGEYRGGTHFITYNSRLPIKYVLRAKLMNDNWFSTLSHLDLESHTSIDGNFIHIFGTINFYVAENYIPIMINDTLRNHLSYELIGYTTDVTSLVQYLVQFVEPNRITVSSNNIEMFMESIAHV